MIRAHATQSRYSRAQSAMEYLMTYGWAILIVAVVLAVLFSLGVFNPSTFAPKAQSGSCQVTRSQAGAQLEGLCNNEIPKYVGSFNVGSIVTSNSFAGAPLTRNQYTSYTIAAWIYLTAPETANEIYDEAVTAGHVLQFGVAGTTLFTAVCLPFQNGGASWYDYGSATANINQNQWIFVTAEATTSGTNPSVSSTFTISYYVNGKTYSSTGAGVQNVPCGFSSVDYYAGVGANPGGFNGAGQPPYGLSGYMSNVQLYNTTLTSSELYALYKEGIGGAPVQTQNLVAWWPLNGDGNDYGGRNFQGSPTNVVWSSSWYSSYTPP